MASNSSAPGVGWQILLGVAGSIAAVGVTTAAGYALAPSGDAKTAGVVGGYATGAIGVGIGGVAGAFISKKWRAAFVTAVVADLLGVPALVLIPAAAAVSAQMPSSSQPQQLPA